MVSSVMSTLLLVEITAVVVGTARGDDGADPLTAGFTLVNMTESRFVVQWPYNVPLDARYEFAGGVRRMWVYSTDKPFSPTLRGARTETKINKVYSSGVWQFVGEVYVPAGTSGACIMQIFGAAPERQATTLMLQVYNGNLTFYHDLQSVLAANIYDRWIRLNVIHDVAAHNVTVSVDGHVRLSSGAPGVPGAPHYFKFGVYKQSHHQPSYRMESMWRNVQLFTKP